MRSKWRKWQTNAANSFKQTSHFLITFFESYSCFNTKPTQFSPDTQSVLRLRFLSGRPALAFDLQVLIYCMCSLLYISALLCQLSPCTLAAWRTGWRKKRGFYGDLSWPIKGKNRSSQVTYVTFLSCRSFLWARLECVSVCLRCAQQRNYFWMSRLLCMFVFHSQRIT